jgi:hypothetical protein
MPEIGLKLDAPRLESFAEVLPRLFYALAGLAFLTAILGSPGTGFLLLLFAGVAHVARVGVDEVLKTRGRGSVQSDLEGLEDVRRLRERQGVRVSRRRRPAGSTR